MDVKPTTRKQWQTMTTAEQLQFINNTALLVKLLPGGEKQPFVEAGKWSLASQQSQWSLLLEMERALFWLLWKQTNNKHEIAFAE